MSKSRGRMGRMIPIWGVHGPSCLRCLLLPAMARLLPWPTRTTSGATADGGALHLRFLPLPAAAVGGGLGPVAMRTWRERGTLIAARSGDTSSAEGPPAAVPGGDPTALERQSSPPKPWRIRNSCGCRPPARDCFLPCRRCCFRCGCAINVATVAELPRAFRVGLGLPPCTP